jgi:hypothetical protein
MVEKYYRQIVRGGYLAGIALMIAALPHSKYGLSSAQFLLAGAWVLERFNLRRLIDRFNSQPLPLALLTVIPRALWLLLAGIGNGFRAFWRNKPALAFSSIFLMHILGLLYTTDFDYAMKDLRTKIPLFILPLFISTSEAFGRKHFYWLILLFAASVVARTLINTWNLVHLNFIDIRDISRPISHIILALLIVQVLFYLAWFIIIKREFRWQMKVLFFLLFIWLVVYLVIARSSTGIVILVVTTILFLVILLFRSRKRWLKYALGTFILLCLATIFIYLNRTVRTYYSVAPFDTAKMDHYTSRGNRYIHYPQFHQKENGNFIYLYVQWDELRETWNQRSNIRFDSLDRKGQDLKFTLIRYLASKDLRRDADGVNALNASDIRNIENGIANVEYQKGFSIRGRIYEFLYGYDKYRETGDPTGSSAMQRLEFWRASAGIIRDTWLTGVGTGDMNIAFDRQYEKMHSKLAKDQRWRSHDQFLSIFVGFGIFGFLWFLFALLYPPLATHRFADFYFLVFFIIAMLSMIPEDTIESQAGVTFLAFFYSLFLFGRNDREPV